MPLPGFCILLCGLDLGHTHEAAGSHSWMLHDASLCRVKEEVMFAAVPHQVLGGVGGHHTASEGRYLMLGNGFLLLNTLAMALYYLRYTK